MVSTRPLISKSPSLLYNPSVTAKSTSYNCLNVTFMFQFFQFPIKVKVFVLLLIFFQFYSIVSRDSKVHNFASSLFFLFPFFFFFLLFLLIIIRSGRQAELRWFVCMSKSHRTLCDSFSRTDARLCIYHLFVWSNLNFLHNSQWIILLTQSCLVLYSFCANLLHSLFMWFIVSFL